MSSVSSLNSLLSSALPGSASSSGINLSQLLQTATGASSEGIDVTSAVNAALYADRAPERQWQAEQSTISSQISTLASIQTVLSSLSNSLNDLNSLSGSLAARSVSSSSANVVTATASPAATVATHSVAVQALATNASWYSASITGGASSLGTSALTITRSDGSQVAFATGSGVNSLSDLANAINASSAGVSASVITDASGDRLALVSSATGSTADFTVSYGASAASAWSSTSRASASASLDATTFQVGDGTSSATITVNTGDTLSTVAGKIDAQGLGLSASVISDASGAHLQITANSGAAVSVSSDPAFSMTRASTATNASLTVDGIPISSASNTVSGAAPGLTLQLTGTTSASSPVALTVSADMSQVSQAMSTFVANYNAALSQVNAQFTYSTSNRSEGALSGDSIVRSLQSTLESVVAYSSPVSSGASSSKIYSLADLGIATQDDGTLTFNTVALKAAMANPAAVQSFFQGTTLNGFAQQFSSDLAQFNDPATGSVTREIGSLNQQYSDLQSQVNDYETGYVASQHTMLTAMYSKAEIALQQLPAEMQQIQAQLGNNSANGR